MPSAQTNFSPADASPFEVSNFSFDFTNALGLGEALTNSTWTVLATYGLDTTPSARLIGGSVVNGSLTTQAIGNLVAGELYTVAATVTTSGNQTLTLDAKLLCRPLPYTYPI